MKKRALLSVSDKTGIQEFASGLVDRGWELLSTGGTARALREADLPVIEVSEVTGHPEMMDGRVKTLHPAVHAGLLARRDNLEDLSALGAQGYGLIDLVAVNLYPFRETVAKPGVTLKEAVEKIDIGGPTMIRSAAKNYRDVWVVVDPVDYGAVLESMDGEGDGADLREALAAKVFRHVSDYDDAIARFLSAPGKGEGVEEEAGFPEALEVSARKRQTLRYGENPDQAAAFYTYPGFEGGLAGLKQLHGKELSYNNLLDLDGALLAISPFAFSPKPAVCIIKHTTPCGLAIGDTLAGAYERALATDPVSAFGSVISFNRCVDGPTAEALSKLFVECIVAPRFMDEAMEVLTQKKNLRLLTLPPGAPDSELEPKGDAWWEEAEEGVRNAARILAAHSRIPEAQVFRSVYGGVLMQGPPNPPYYGLDGEEWKVVTDRAPTDAEMDDLKFAWAAVYGVKSNAILLAANGGTLGIGAGQMSRVDSSKIAVRKAGEAGLDLAGAALASDAFFPFRDGVDAAAEAGVKAIVEPGGSMRDEEVIAAANEHGIAMVFTGRRSFRH
ncbi:MAG: bifunctional phosphoribosylaminoimidazolecarboxamide formyltransferase/IMP cyclohydrolase [Gemmatimonadetes bacterium]|nr:bifunctional phosphoribosylaminoimidazolecarboxamide formyltransferase/IMP cyclohydrolase [Gemmatimonadota bacterium]NNM07415.1 bifunctional phosphoribosylaminoimidazolecarboxamide formyltransferase/IMP cyclohydrolase [Gemmatimonadota bacterium]